MNFKDMLSCVSWDDIKSSLVKNYDVSENNLIGYFNVFLKLQSLESQNTDMRICVNWIEPDNNLIEEGYWDVYGKNGTFNKDTEDANLFLDASEDWLNSEVNWAIEFREWSELLGMEIDSETANNIELSKADIVAHILYEMTFISYNEEDVQDTFNEIIKQAEEFKNMSEEELRKNTFTLEELEEKLKEIKDEEDE